MIDFLLSVPGRCQLILNGVNSLTANFTSTVASRIDAAISSRAAAATALSNTVWTNARAATLDTLAALSANLSTMLQRPPLNPISIFSWNGSLTVATFNAVKNVSGLQQDGPISPGAGAYATLINEVGRGNINFLAIKEHVQPASGTRGYRITIDGLAFTGNFSTPGSGRAGVLFGAMAVDDSAGAGSEQPSGIAFENIPFLTGFKVEVTNSVAGGQYLSYSRYRRTG